MPRAASNAATQPPAKTYDLAAAWVGGMRTDVDPLLLSDQQYRSGMNVLCNRGIVRPRKPMRRIATLPTGHPQALTDWVDGSGRVWMVAVVAGKVYVTRSPFSWWYRMTGYEFRADARQVFHEAAVKNARTESSGVIVTQPPENLLFLSDGYQQVARFDGNTLEAISPALPTFGPPIGTTVMKWSGNRLWCMRGRELHASNIGEPDKFTESRQLAGGGFLAFRRPLTSLAQPVSRGGLFAFTDVETFYIRSDISDRNSWQTTPDFQQRIFDEIGCIAPKSVVSHYGKCQWLSARGVISLDEAQRTYQTAAFKPLDDAMWENRDRLSRDASQACGASFENLLLFSLPAGDKWNRETWVRDVDSGGDSPAWAGAMVGVLPVEWACVQDGSHQRLFCLARESADSAAVHVWEYDAHGAGSGCMGDAEWPLCQMETGLFKVTADFDVRQFAHAAIELTDMRGAVQLRVYVAPARSRVYRQILERRLDAGGNVLSLSGDAGPLDYEFVAQRSQSRVVRTEEFQPSTDDVADVDRPDFLNDHDSTPSRDRGFSLLIEWRGDCGIRAIRLFTTAKSSGDRGGAYGDEPEGGQRSPEQHRLTPDFVEDVPTERAPVPITDLQTSPIPS